MRATLSVAFFIFSKFSVSFLGQKRAVGKWEVYIVISKNWLFFRWMFSFGHSRCLPIERGEHARTSWKVKIFTGGCFLGISLPTTWRDFHKPYSGRRWWSQAPPQKYFLSVGWLWPPQMSGYMKGLFFGTVKYGSPRLGDGHKHHLKRIRNYFLN